MSEQAKERRNWIGVSLLVIGAVFLFRNYDWHIFYFPEFLFSWRFLLIGIGLLLLLTGRRAGIFFIAAGVFFLFTEEIMMFIYNMGSWWPLLLIALGILLLVRPANRSSQNNKSTN